MQDGFQEPWRTVTHLDFGLGRDAPEAVRFDVQKFLLHNIPTFLLALRSSSEGGRM
jgi:hypothetical protein